MIAEFRKKNCQNNRNIPYTCKSKLKWKWTVSSLVLSVPLECLPTLVLREVILVEWSKRKQNLTCALTLIIIIKWSCQICVIIVCAFLVYWISLDTCVRRLLTYHGVFDIVHTGIIIFAIFHKFIHIKSEHKSHKCKCEWRELIIHE